MAQEYQEPQERKVIGFRVLVDDNLGHLMVSHDGNITWEQLQCIKSQVWGADARAIEVYPAHGQVVNNGNYRHLWRLGDDDFCPDLLGNAPPRETLERRFTKAWSAANG